MRLSPLDIRKQEFGRSLRGLNPEEVSSFLEMVSHQWDDLLSEQRQLEQRVKELEAKLEHYSNVEEALQEALRTARESSKQALESAKQQALGIIREAERRSDEMRRSAEQEWIGLRKEANEVLVRRNEIAARLRAFLQSELELLARFEADFPVQGAAASTRPTDIQENRVEAGTMAAGVSPAHEEETPEPVRSAEYEELPEAGEPKSAEHVERGEEEHSWKSQETAMLPESQDTDGAMADRADVHAPEPAAFQGEPRGGAGFVVRQVFGASSSMPATAASEPKPDAMSEQESIGEHVSSASEDEIERIRRILKDLE